MAAEFRELFKISIFVLLKFVIRYHARTRARTAGRFMLQVYCLVHVIEYACLVHRLILFMQNVYSLSKLIF